MNLHKTLPLIAALCAAGVFAADKPAEPAKEATPENAKPGKKAPRFVSG